jgi:phage tail-like protein
MPPTGIQEPGVARAFYVSITGIDNAYFKEVTGGDIEIEVIDVRQTTKNGELMNLKAKGNVKYSNIVLKRGVTADKALSQWFQTCVTKGPDGQRKNGSITAYDSQGQPVLVTNFTNAWPCKCSGLSMDASKNEFTVEQFELSVESIKRDQ